MQNWDIDTLKINYLAFMHGLLIENNLANFNNINISMKAKSLIKMFKNNNYEKTNIKAYQRFMEKLIYLLCGIKPDISFIIRQLSKWNADLNVSHFNTAK